ncbi:hypothetical protein SOVF_111730, partial [Spinacia oleracea]
MSSERDSDNVLSGAGYDDADLASTSEDVNFEDDDKPSTSDYFEPSYEDAAKELQAHMRKQVRADIRRDLNLVDNCETIPAVDAPSIALEYELRSWTQFMDPAGKGYGDYGTNFGNVVVSFNQDAIRGAHLEDVAGGSRQMDEGEVSSRANDVAGSDNSAGSGGEEDEDIGDSILDSDDDIGKLWDDGEDVTSLCEQVLREGDLDVEPDSDTEEMRYRFESPPPAAADENIAGQGGDVVANVEPIAQPDLMVVDLMTPTRQNQEQEVNDTDVAGMGQKTPPLLPPTLHTSSGYVRPSQSAVELVKMYLCYQEQNEVLQKRQADLDQQLGDTKRDLDQKSSELERLKRRNKELENVANQLTAEEIKNKELSEKLQEADEKAKTAYKTGARDGALRFTRSQTYSKRITDSHNGGWFAAHRCGVHGIGLTQEDCQDIEYAFLVEQKHKEPTGWETVELVKMYLCYQEQNEVLQKRQADLDQQLGDTK